MIGAREIALLPRGSYLINAVTRRSARSERRARRAARTIISPDVALDVFDPEPPDGAAPGRSAADPHAARRRLLVRGEDDGGRAVVREDRGVLRLGVRWRGGRTPELPLWYATRPASGGFTPQQSLARYRTPRLRARHPGTPPSPGSRRSGRRGGGRTARRAARSPRASRPRSIPSPRPGAASTRR